MLTSHLTKKKYRSVVPTETHRCKYTCCEGTCGFGKLNTRVSPDVLCSGGRRLGPFLVWFHVCRCIDVVIKTLCYTEYSTCCGNRAAVLLLFCHLHQQRWSNPAEQTYIHNLKAQKANSLNSFK